MQASLRVRCQSPRHGVFAAQAKDKCKKLQEKLQNNDLESQPGRTLIESFETQVRRSDAPCQSHHGCPPGRFCSAYGLRSVLMLHQAKLSRAALTALTDKGVLCSAPSVLQQCARHEPRWSQMALQKPRRPLQSPGPDAARPPSLMRR